MSGGWAILAILICGALGAQAPFIFSLFVGSKAFEIDRQNYDVEELDNYKYTYRIFEKIALILFFIPLLIYVDKDFSHKYWPIGVMFGMIGFVYMVSFLFAKFSFGPSGLRAYLAYAAERMGLSIKLFLSLHVFFCIMGAICSLGTAIELFQK